MRNVSETGSSQVTSIFRHRCAETAAMGIIVMMFWTTKGTVWRGPVDTCGCGASRHPHLGAGTHTESAQTLSAYAAQSESLSHWTRSLSTAREQDVVSAQPKSINPATLRLAFRTNLSGPPRAILLGGGAFVNNSMWQGDSVVAAGWTEDQVGGAAPPSVLVFGFSRQREPSSVDSVRALVEPGHSSA